jgi:undecaprenyl phosphate-alpha-L-ara4N flippase subunit ArnE
MATKLWAIGLVLLCTLFTTSAQIFLKIGADKLPLIFFNWSLFIGILLYAIGAVLLIMAFKGGEVTVIYPIFASSYVWVSLLSAYFFSETLGLLKIAGIFVVILGITFIAVGSRKGSAIEYMEAP